MTVIVIFRWPSICGYRDHSFPKLMAEIIIIIIWFCDGDCGSDLGSSFSSVQLEAESYKFNTIISNIPYDWQDYAGGAVKSSNTGHKINICSGIHPRKMNIVSPKQCIEYLYCVTNIPSSSAFGLGWGWILIDGEGKRISTAATSLAELPTFSLSASSFAEKHKILHWLE